MDDSHTALLLAAWQDEGEAGGHGGGAHTPIRRHIAARSPPPLAPHRPRVAEPRRRFVRQERVRDRSRSPRERGVVDSPSVDRFKSGPEAPGADAVVSPAEQYLRNQLEKARNEVALAKEEANVYKLAYTHAVAAQTRLLSAAPPPPAAENGSTCSICMHPLEDGEAQCDRRVVVFKECGHAGMCHACARQCSNRCPICRKWSAFTALYRS